MSVQTPPKLQKLAIQTLLRNEALAMSSLEELPHVLYPAVFEEAFAGRHTKLIKAMVAAWPYRSLPVGSFMKEPNVENLQAVLDGVDVRLKREFYPGRAKLQVLDMRNMHWDEADDSDCSVETLDKKQVVRVFPSCAEEQHLKVIVDLFFTSHQSESKAIFLNWAQQRKAYLHLCCTKMKIWSLPSQFIREILNVFDPEYITELDLSVDWTLSELAHLAPYLGQMNNLRKFFLEPLFNDTYPITNVTRVEEEVKCVDLIISQFSRLNCLQHIYLKYVPLHHIKMKQFLGCLRMPLETFSITHCQISQPDLDSLSCSHSLFQLKHLEIGMALYDFDLTHLRGLLEKVADTLETLDLSWCKMNDSQLSVLLPALTQCSQLNKINFYNNDFSMPILKDLLQHTANWSKMNVEKYPAPLECYGELNFVSRERFVQLCRELMDTLSIIRQPKNICFATDICPACRDNFVYGQEDKFCACWQ